MRTARSTEPDLAASAYTVSAKQGHPFTIQLDFTHRPKAVPLCNLDRGQVVAVDQTGGLLKLAASIEPSKGRGDCLVSIARSRIWATFLDYEKAGPQLSRLLECLPPMC